MIKNIRSMNRKQKQRLKQNIKWLFGQIWVQAILGFLLIYGMAVIAEFV